MKGYIPLMKYFFLFGLVLFGISYAFIRLSLHEHKKNVKLLESEKKELKAKLFDLQEECKDVNAQKNPPPTDINETDSDKPKIVD